ncbi:MAG: methanogenesis marker 14 protein [Methanocellales archaeon]|nr:methanogenesis marker 14 protein [Methanocellales archaeon]MDD3290933.1 methanogenesis marker 14 protein [Methanocellales archaeon]MDD3292323.1 methanogenesis marker 14 protein [Methanocellales archaeon]MDD5234818.1 methanogenesis marker 14 protein [Methanocellales archaeon]MDD5484812.1 methanogenesis marker 14 protein [Methanocellales archaeon]
MIEIAKSRFVDASFILRDNVYVVASVELGNTTIKSILTATDLIEGRTYFLDKTVELTKSLRPPKENEYVFGRTVRGQPLSREAISEAIKNILLRSMTKAMISVNDLDFVVRSTGVVAGFETPEEVGEIIKALADGCLKAGVPPRKMTGAMRKVDLPESLQRFSFMDDIIFDGAVAGVECTMPIVANEMESELVLAGIKEGAKWTHVDFRSPCIGLDFGTTLAGRATNAEVPYASVVGSYCGLAGAIFDALAQPVADTALQLLGSSEGNIPESYVEDVMRLIKIKRVTSEKRFGTVPVNPKGLKESGIVLLGVDVGTNGDRLNELSEISAELLEEDRRNIGGLIDKVSSELVKSLIEISWDYGLKGAIGITGRGAITGAKPAMIREKLGIQDLVFVDDGLARGAAVLARCLHSLGTPKSPIGGIRGGKCVMSMRR